MTELSAVGHVISKLRSKSIFNFTEIVNNQGLRQGTACQMVRFIFHFSLKLHIQFLKKNFYSMILCRVGNDYYKK